MGFHRYTTPTYTGGMPVGYDLINVVSGGAGAGGSALVDGPKGSGTNVGTYFFAFGENATSLHFNRGLAALATNTDLLDDQLRRDIAVMVRTALVNPGAPVGSITLPAGTYLGNSDYANTANDLNRLFKVVDTNNDGVFDEATGSPITVTSVTLGVGDQIGGGGASGKFSANTVQLNLNTSIPAGLSYRVYYLTRGNLATAAENFSSLFGANSVVQVPETVKYVLNEIQGTGQSWNDPPLTTLYDTHRRGLHESYGHYGEEQSASAPEAYFQSGQTELPGAGAWFLRRGPGITGYVDQAGYKDPIGAVFASKFRTPAGTNIGAAISFVSLGARLSYTALANEKTYEAGVGHFLAAQGHHHQAGLTSAAYTHVPVNAPCTLASSGSEATVQVTNVADYWRRPGTQTSAVVLGYTLVELSYTQSGNPVRRTVVAVDFNNDTTLKVRDLDDRLPVFTGASAATVVAWYSPTFFVGDGEPTRHALEQSVVDAVRLDGLYFSRPPDLGAGGVSSDVDAGAATFLGSSSSTAPVIRWGHHRSTTPWTPNILGVLRADGTIDCAGLIATDVEIANLEVTQSLIATAPTLALFNTGTELRMAAGSTLRVSSGGDLLLQGTLTKSGTGARVQNRRTTATNIATTPNPNFDIWEITVNDGSTYAALLNNTTSPAPVVGELLYIRRIGTNGILNIANEIAPAQPIASFGNTFEGGCTLYFDGTRYRLLGIWRTGDSGVGVAP